MYNYYIIKYTILCIKYKNNYPGLEGDLEISSDNIGKLFKAYKDINILNDKLKLTSKLSLSFENNNLLYSIYNLLHLRHITSKIFFFFFL